MFPDFCETHLLFIHAISLLSTHDDGYIFIENGVQNEK